jgi:hypothetical protein
MFDKARFRGRLGATTRWVEAYRDAWVGVHLGSPCTSAAFHDASMAPRRASMRTRWRLGGSARAQEYVFTGRSARKSGRLRGKEKSRVPVPIERIRERQRDRER